MKNIELYIPKVNELGFRQLCLEDEKTMSYNAGYDLGIKGYHKDTGCMDFPKSEWEGWYNRKMTNPNFYLAYIKDVDLAEFVGMVNYSLDTDTNKASIGINIYSKYQGQGYMKPALKALCEVAKQKGIKVLTDTVPDSREIALNGFYSLNFEVKDSYKQKKFDKDETVLIIEKEL